ncbi:uncharacterized protein LOC124475971 [Hypomesus transpacificus]|uniref:uncharacterized protein LOC124475971 n=1 Tax=Hypomesus transpacificus TaxID=137520 RepID=UPI001F071390|nr:uncharacterized protein LOC124475971 [Hypomesus transpacificus]XP_046888841.1 uncharacterized protein LOC124475971 [Hypomesus transpacificus]XP_046888842.1 uncharacterized protein LOC124475971 [Hypomesus transpacificus]XP_046888843.1 uncharacterized protein LOC124475971 [Hypomesus transpacificus]XP_046888844.1 uncharacterized protein LOC124475971 [Hypomesus transpacificus]XP_046888845.1 uncharacterized protein LOC124475971 [Hypomesus transpacificus]
MEMLPQLFCNILPAFLTHKKAICKTVMDELCRTGRSATDMANQLNEALHLRYERAHLAYLLTVQNVQDGDSGLYGQKTITGTMRKDNTPDPFGTYDSTNGWCGVAISPRYLVDCLVHEYHRKEKTLTLVLQGTFGQVIRADHTRKVARKVVLSSGTMSSYSVMNENWMILSWVMLQSESDRSLEPMYEGLSHRYDSAGLPKAKYQWVDRDCCADFRIPNLDPQEHLHWDSWKTTEAVVTGATSGNLTNSCASRGKYSSDITVKLDLFHCMRRFSRECVSEHHTLHSTFCRFLSAAFCVVDQTDLQRLTEAYAFCGIRPANPTKQHIREHCRTKVPQPTELLERVESVLKQFFLETDPNGVYLFKPSMLKLWRLQRVHILRGCLSDPEEEDGILYRHGGTVQLNHVKGEGAAVPVWIPEDIFGEASGVLPQTTVQPVQSTSTQGLPKTPALPITANPRAARTMSIKAGGLLYVLDHSRWTEAMKEVIDGLIGIHQGSKDFLQRVDSDYAGLVQAASRDPNSLLHPTTKQHISQYVKH